MPELGIPGLRWREEKRSYFLDKSWKDSSGVMRRVTKTFPGDLGRRELRRQVREFIATIDSGTMTGARDTVAELWQRFILMKRETRKLAPSTLASYERMWRDHIAPSIGSMPASRVAPGDMQSIVDRCVEKGLSPKTIHNVVIFCHGLFRQALRWRIVARNPVDGVTMPQADPPKFNVPTPEELVQLMDAAEGEWAIPVAVACATGARRGEVLGLCWDSVNADCTRLFIERQLQTIPRPGGGSDLRLVRLKTDRSRRELYIPAFLGERLKAHHREQLQRRLAFAGQWSRFAAEHGGVVADGGDGRPLLPDSFSSHFRRLVAKVGLPDGTRLHDVRHACATLLLREHVPMPVVSAQLGHASPGFTAAVYAHVTDNLREEAATAIESALSGNVG